MKFPDFIIAGFMKCGTTQLFLNLNKHPGVTMCKPAGPIRPGLSGGTEMRFWGLNNWKRGIDWYKSKFKGDICGEKSPDYAGYKKCIRLMSKHAPDTKLLIGIRNPLHRAYSHYQMNVQQRKVSWPFTLSNCKRQNRGKMYLRLGMYHKLLANNIFEFFPREQVYIYICEKMKNNLTEEMKKLCEFIGAEQIELPSEVIPTSQRYSKRRKDDMYKDGQDKVYKVWSREYEPLKKKVKREFNSFYREHNKKLFDLLGYRIKEWE